MAGASVVRPTRTVTGERRRWKKTKMTIRPSEPGIQGLKKEKKTLNYKCQKKIIMHTDNKRESNICSLLDTFPPLRDDAQI